MYNDSFRAHYGNAPIAISSTENFTPTRPHIHNQVEMLYIVKGSSEIQISNNTFQAKAGDLFFVNPLEVHAVTVNTAAPYCHRCICFERSLIADKKLSDDLQKGYVAIPYCFTAEEEITGRLSALFEEMYEAVTRNSAALLFEVTALVSSMFSLFINHHLLIDHSAENKQSAFCAEVTNYISRHYSEEITSHEIAQSLFYTQSHFCRKFKRIFGVSFSEYLTMYRLLAGKEKLIAENKSVGAIAAECGFRSANYFTACFKKTFKITPLRYRKINTVLK
ncbi:MAG: helix-turn-helix transcriptional regulator [Clostridia bacterium]|nr:helix-turn-helix transcriptional regulator [Clostridia bacterium]